MTKMFLSMMIMLNSINMFFLNNPLSMGLLILIQTLMTCMLSGMMIKTYWFSYILFLTFLGGLLVLFIYVSSIASNELFIMNLNSKIYLLMSIFITIIMMIIYNKNLLWWNMNHNYDMNKFFNKFLLYNMENKINLNKLYNNYNLMMMMLLVIYLFITLVVVVKITNISFGPIRASF
uniref:NADH dehydrogenase subunit 6 n=1 Tax=Syntypistis chambae TaxID=1973588 RepID=UPI001FB00AD5|nr:NADH dehydrogenase subunit 6 [Syntypistis chambae]UNP54478.1 NADH dehydrogenase subunit 6 [Syntypistis chambae]